jgi:ribosomal protein S18 acetylase RimI-like enzyme
MIIRPVAPMDRDALLDMVSASFRPDESAVALELIDDAIAGSDDYWILVAADVPGPAHSMGGYICYGPTPMTASTYDLYWIVTHPQARGRGVAGALIQAMEAELGRREATGVRVETSEIESYGAARRLYARHDYPQVAHLVDFYRPGDGLIIYYKRL